MNVLAKPISCIQQVRKPPLRPEGSSGGCCVGIRGQEKQSLEVGRC